MQLNVEDVNSVKKILHIEVPEKTVTRELDKAYGQLKKTAKIKGFRPGKAPRSVLERIYSKDVQTDVSSRLIQESFMEAIKQTDLKMLGTPKIEPPQLAEGKPYAYEATVEIPPEIGQIDYSGLTLKKTNYQAGEAEIETQLKMLQKKLAQHDKIKEERPAAAGDFVLIDYEGFKDGEALPDIPKTENYTLKLGDGTIHKDFDDQIAGMQPGDTKKFTIAYAEDDPQEALAGTVIEYEVKLNEIRAEVLPPMDDEMATKLGPYKTLDELKKAITDNLTEGYEKRSEQELQEQIFQALITKTEFELPDVLVKYELEGILAEAERTFAYHNQSLETLGLSRDVLAEKYRETAEKQVRRQLILNQIIEQETLTLSDETIETGYRDIAARFGQPIEDIKKYYGENPDKLQYYKQTLLEKKAVDLIIEGSSIEHVEPEQADAGDEKTETTAAT